MTISISILVSIAVAAFLLGLFSPILILIYLVWTANID